MKISLFTNQNIVPVRGNSLITNGPYTDLIIGYRGNLSTIFGLKEMKNYRVWSNLMVIQTLVHHKRFYLINNEFLFFLRTFIL